jgi:phage terminase small subunit
MSHPEASPLPPRQEFFAYHVAQGASLAQAARLAGYSPQGARQRGSLLMSDSDIRLRVEALRRSWLAEREKQIGEAVAEVAQVIDTALRLDRPGAAIKAIELKLKLRGIIRDPRFSLYNATPDDDLTTAMFDPREDEDPPLDLPPADIPAEIPVEAPPPVQVIPAPEPPSPEPSAPKLPVSEPAAPAAPAAVPDLDLGPGQPVFRMPPPPPGLHEALNEYKKTLRAMPVPKPTGKA